jgi:hypothetical protein
MLVMPNELLQATAIELFGSQADRPRIPLWFQVQIQLYVKYS